MFADFMEKNSGGCRPVQNSFFLSQSPHEYFHDTESLIPRLGQIYGNAVTHRTAPIFFGGDHTITYHLIEFIVKSGKKTCLVVFDAHSDCQGSEPTLKNWNFLKKIKEDFSEAVSVIHIGFRDIDIGSLQSYADYVYDMEEIFSIGLDEIARNISRICEGHRVHVSFDLDVIDPLLFASVNSPISGGLIPAQAKRILHLLRGPNIVSADIVEFSSSGQNLLMEMLWLADLFYTLESLCGARNSFSDPH